MMCDVVPIVAKKETLKGEAHCLSCQHEWIGVAEVGVHELDCPKCGSYKGVFRGFTAPSTAWHCNCGSYLFFIGTYGSVCSICGITTIFDD